MSGHARERLAVIFGGSGFTGSHLVQDLLNRGVPTRVFSRKPWRSEVATEEEVEVVLGDIGSRADVQRGLAGVTDIVYLVQSTVPASSMDDLRYDVTSNVIPFISFLEQVRQSRTAKRLVYVSSGGTVYGNPREAVPFTEGHPTFPVSSYGLTKLMSEHYVRLILARSGVTSYILRPSNAYGERQDLTRHQGAVGIFLKALHDGLPITLYGGGTAVRDFVYIGDVVRAVSGCLDDRREHFVPVTYNVGSSTGLSLSALVTTIEELAGQRLTIHHEPARAFDCTYNVLDTSAIRRDLGWSARTPLRTGLEQTWKWTQSLARNAQPAPVE
jgi:UDP-glucose 4-epimerase